MALSHEHEPDDLRHLFSMGSQHGFSAWVLSVVPQRASSAWFLRRGRAGLQAGAHPPHVCHFERSEESASFQIQIMWGRAPPPVQAEQSSAPPSTRPEEHTTIPNSGTHIVEVSQAPIDPCVGGLWMIDANRKASIYLRNGLETSSLTATPSLYHSNGAKYQLAPVTLEASGTAVISVNEALRQKGISPWAMLSGYVEVEYTWAWDPLCVTWCFLPGPCSHRSPWPAMFLRNQFL